MKRESFAGGICTYNNTFPKTAFIHAFIIYIFPNTSIRCAFSQAFQSQKYLSLSMILISALLYYYTHMFLLVICFIVKYLVFQPEIH